MAWNPDNEAGFWVDMFITPILSYPSVALGVEFVTPPPIPPGHQYTATIVYSFTEQQIDEIEAFYVRVDNAASDCPYGLVPESNEMNNLGGPVDPFSYSIYLPLVTRQ